MAETEPRVNKNKIDGSPGIKRIATLLAILAPGIAATGCTIHSHVDELPVSQPLAPMPKPSWEVGTTWHYLAKWKLFDSGTRVWRQVEAQRDDLHRLITNQGCKVTQADWFTPAVHVRDCRAAGAGFTQEVTPTFDTWPLEGGIKQQVKRVGDTWPLQVGKSWHYKTSGVNSRGWEWEEMDSRCVVESEVRVEIPAGGFDTFKVVCESKWWKGTWYVAPSLGTYALYISDPDLTERKRYEYLETSPPELSGP